MSGVDVVVTHFQRRPQAQLEGRFGARREGYMSSRPTAAAAAEESNHVRSGSFKIDTQIHDETLGSHSVAFSDETQEDVFSTDVAVTERSSFLLCQHDHLSSLIGEALEHEQGLLEGSHSIIFY